MSIFGKTPAETELAAARTEADDYADRLCNEQQLRAEAESRMAAMVKHRDPAQMDQIALDGAARVEDIFARGWEGGAVQRKAAVQNLIRGLIDAALNGADA